MFKKLSFWRNIQGACWINEIKYQQNEDILGFVKIIDIRHFLNTIAQAKHWRCTFVRPSTDSQMNETVMYLKTNMAIWELSVAPALSLSDQQTHI